MALLLDKAKAAGLELEKKGLPNPPILRVAEVIDVSGSMRNTFASGDVQAACDQLLGAALKLDDNGEIDVYAFDDKYTKIGVANADDYQTFVQKKMTPKLNGFWNGTQYADVIEAVEQDMFGGTAKSKSFLTKLFSANKSDTDAQPNMMPVVAFLITDGENSDKEAAERALVSAARFPIYWNLVGIGNTKFTWLQKMADQYDNVGFIKLSGLRLSDEQMYESLFTKEFVDWAKQFPAGVRS